MSEKKIVSLTKDQRAAKAAQTTQAAFAALEQERAASAAKVAKLKALREAGAHVQPPAAAELTRCA